MRKTQTGEICATDSEIITTKKTLLLENGPCHLTRRNTFSNDGFRPTTETYTFEKECNFRCDADEILAPEVILRVAEQFDEGNQCSPRMRAMDNEPL